MGPRTNKDTRIKTFLDESLRTKRFGKKLFYVAEFSNGGYIFSVRSLHQTRLYKDKQDEYEVFLEYAKLKGTFRDLSTENLTKYKSQFFNGLRKCSCNGEFKKIDEDQVQKYEFTPNKDYKYFMFITGSQKESDCKKVVKSGRVQKEKPKHKACKDLESNGSQFQHNAQRSTITTSHEVFVQERAENIDDPAENFEESQEMYTRDQYINILISPLVLQQIITYPDSIKSIELNGPKTDFDKHYYEISLVVAKPHGETFIIDDKISINLQDVLVQSFTCEPHFITSEMTKYVVVESLLSLPSVTLNNRMRVEFIIQANLVRSILIKLLGNVSNGYIEKEINENLSEENGPLLIGKYQKPTAEDALTKENPFLGLPSSQENPLLSTDDAISHIKNEMCYISSSHSFCKTDAELDKYVENQELLDDYLFGLRTNSEAPEFEPKLALSLPKD